MVRLIPLIFLIAQTIRAQNCPEPCICTDISVSCINQNLDNVPDLNNLKIIPEIIDMSGNDLGSIDDKVFDFDQSLEVREIYLNNSEIFLIDEDAFVDVKNLQELYLSHNMLNGIPEDILDGQEMIILLDLSHNEFQTMPKIKSASLQILILTSSKIDTVPMKILDNLSNLKSLQLQQNNIHYISPSIFRYTNNLMVNISYNSWRCNCRTTDLFDYLIATNTIQTTDPIHCRTENKVFMNMMESNLLNQFKKKCLKNFNSADLIELSSTSIATTKKLEENTSTTPQNSESLNFLWKENRDATKNASLINPEEKIVKESGWNVIIGRNRKKFEVESNFEKMEENSVKFNLIVLLISILGAAFTVTVLVMHYRNRYSQMSRPKKAVPENADSRSKLMIYQEDV